MGRRLSDNLTSDMSFIMEQVNRNPSRLKEMQALSSQNSVWNSSITAIRTN